MLSTNKIIHNNNKCVLVLIDENLTFKNRILEQRIRQTIKMGQMSSTKMCRRLWTVPSIVILFGFLLSLSTVAATLNVRQKHNAPRLIADEERDKREAGKCSVFVLEFLLFQPLVNDKFTYWILTLLYLKLQCTKLLGKKTTTTISDGKTRNFMGDINFISIYTINIGACFFSSVRLPLHLFLSFFVRKSFKHKILFTLRPHQCAWSG